MEDKKGKIISKKIPTSPTMPRVADYPSRSVWEEAAWHALITYFATLQKPKDIDAMLRILITSHERSLFMRRMTAINRILEKKTYQ
ncbi:MAG: hypothetical protein AAB611_03485, partial [Patescibacteria group bacterium]